MQRSLVFLQHKRVPTHRQYTDRPSRILHTRDSHELRTRLTRLLHEFRLAKFVLRKRLDIRNRLASQALGEEPDFVALDVLDDEDLELREEMQGKVGDGIAEDGFLDKEDVAARFFDAFAKVEEVLTFFLQNFVHLAVVVDDDGVIHLKTQAIVRTKVEEDRVRD